MWMYRLTTLKRSRRSWLYALSSSQAQDYSILRQHRCIRSCRMKRKVVPQLSTDSWLKDILPLMKYSAEERLIPSRRWRDLKLWTSSCWWGSRQNQWHSLGTSWLLLSLLMTACEINDSKLLVTQEILGLKPDFSLLVTVNTSNYRCHMTCNLQYVCVCHLGVLFWDPLGDPLRDPLGDVLADV
jgi:hypothetical protein